MKKLMPQAWSQCLASPRCSRWLKRKRKRTPPGATLRPGALQEGTLVVAMYQERENGDKVLTRLSLGKSEPAPATPSESPKRSE